jgi:hypothetical protein
MWDSGFVWYHVCKLREQLWVIIVLCDRCEQPIDTHQVSETESCGKCEILHAKWLRPLPLILNIILKHKNTLLQKYGTWRKINFLFITVTLQIFFYQMNGGRRNAKGWELLVYTEGLYYKCTNDIVAPVQKDMYARWHMSKLKTCAVFIL